MQLSAPHVQSVIPKSNELGFLPSIILYHSDERNFQLSILLLQPSDFMLMVKTSSQEFFLTFINEFIKIRTLTVVYLL